MNENWRTQVESFLYFANDLGLGPFYRNRAACPSFSKNERLRATSSQHREIDSSAAATTTAAVSRNSFFPTPQQPKPAIPILRGPSGPSLFEQRVENDTLERIRADIGDCTRCKLHKGRTNIVFGVGDPKANLVFVGEGPGHDEDVQGEPFVGRAGKLLTQMIEAMGLRRDDVYICNVVKCRPPENRLPERDEITICSPFLARQLAAIQPKVICCLGACSAQTLLETNQGISRFRGEWFDYRGARLIATYHPAYLLRNPSAKGEVWKDLQKVMSVLGLKPKQRR